MTVRRWPRVAALCAGLALTVQLSAALPPAPPPGPVPDTSDIDQLAGPSVVTVAVVYHVEPAHEAEVVADLRALSAADRLEKGNISTSVHKALGGAHDYLLYEQFETPAAVAAHRNGAAYKRYVTGGLAHLATTRCSGQFTPLLPE